MLTLEQMFFAAPQFATGAQHCVSSMHNRSCTVALGVHGRVLNEDPVNEWFCRGNPALS